jgi:hypothetical protein
VMLTRGWVSLLRGLGVMVTREWVNVLRGLRVISWVGQFVEETGSDADWLDCGWVNLLRRLGVMLTGLIGGGSIC